MSSPEVERFEVTQEDLDNEFNPFRPQFRQTKHQATYGIWADEDSDDERPSFGGPRGRKNKDYTAPVNFVSGGVKIGDKLQEKEKEGVDAISDSDEEPEPAPAPTYGKQRSGFSGSRGTAYKKMEGPPPSRGMRGRGMQSNLSETFGGWEVHTKGIGKKIMEKFGFKEGTGLGKNMQGISTPVEAKLRKGKGAVGFYGSERTERSLQDFPMGADPDEEAEKKFKDQLQQWKKGDVSKKQKKPKYTYKTADEIIASGSKKRTVVQSELSRVKVIDMTGKEKRVLSGYHAISSKHDKPDEELVVEERGDGKRAFDMPELLHNLDLLVEMAEDEILQNNKRLHNDQDLVVNLQHEKDKLDDVCANEKKQINKLTTILEIVGDFERRTIPGAEDPLTMEECAKLFSHLQEDYYEEYKIYDLGSLGIALLLPLMKREFEGWEPLRRPRFGLQTMNNWKEILEGPNQSLGGGGGGEMTDPYEKLLWEVWMPHIRNTISVKWSVRECDPLIELLELWAPLLPRWMLFNILEQMIMPRLQSEVSEWNPLTDTVPIHAWLHPWLPLMGDRLEPLYAPIRHKLSSALTNWHPSDPSAKMILQPWVKVFKQGHMDAFLVKNIAPKLELGMQEFIINPHQQVLDAWNWTMTWLDMMPAAAVITILEKCFFPRWHQVLLTWLTANPNYDEVTKWYTGWKALVPEVIRNHPAIKEQMNRALDTMNRAVSGTLYPQPGARENMAYFTSNERLREFDSQFTSYQMPPQVPPPPPPPVPTDEVRNVPTASTLPTTFRELIEKKAEENDVLFMPLVGKMWESKQVFQFGRLHIVVDRGVIFMQQDNGTWVPVSLQTIIDRGR